MFEQAYAEQIPSPSGFDQEERQRDADRHRQREAELEAEQGVSWGQPDHFERHQIMEQARRDVLREKWVEQNTTRMAVDQGAARNPLRKTGADRRSGQTPSRASGGVPLGSRPRAARNSRM